MGGATIKQYLNETGAGQQYQNYFSDLEIARADADAQADPRY
ncbi:MAG TPA: hypothetical protein VFI31_20160 [Pirellulales bacterium]|nr:hypothetical protein [Pirellulales bacterium]